MDKIVPDSSDSDKWPSGGPDATSSQIRTSSWMDGSSSLCEYSDTSAVESSSSQTHSKEPDQLFNSKVPSSAGDEDGSQNLNPNYKPSSWTSDPDGGPITASEEPPSTPLSTVGALNNKEEWAGLKAGPNDDGRESALRGGDTAGEKKIDDGGIPQGVWDREMRGSNESTGWTSDSVEDVRDASRVSAVFANNSVKSRDDNQRGVHDAVDGESARRDDGTHVQTVRPEETLQTMISRSNLDPRVLCNTGWGQTQIKQSVAWNLELDSENMKGDDGNSGRCKEGWESAGDALYSSSKIQKQEGLEDSRGQGWRGEERNERTAVKRDGWGMQGDIRTGGKDSGWGEAQDDEKREEVRWNPSGRREWSEAGGDPKSQGEGLWGGSEETGGWRGEKHPPSQIPNKQLAPKSQNQQQPGHPKTTQDRDHSETKGSGWTSGPIPQISSAVDSSGWEEPSPQSLSRNVDIDDGTSAWGDPSRYNSKNVNLWDKTSSQNQPQSSQSSGRQPAAPSKSTGKMKTMHDIVQRRTAY